MKDLYNTQALDELEADLLNDEISFESIDNLDNEKNRFQNIAKSSIEKRALLNEVMKDEDFEPFMKVILANGIGTKEAFHNLFHKVANGNINPKLLASS